MKFNRRRTASSVALFAAGVLFALSFVATPVKFLADGVGLPDLLAVGRVTFRASLFVELTLGALLIVLATGRGRTLALTFVVLLGIQHFILMPVLDVRTLARMTGEIAEPSALHAIWIVCDIAKLALLAWIGIAPSREPNQAR